MNAKHVMSLVVAGLVGAAGALASADPALSTYCHIVQALVAAFGPYLAMTSPKVSS